MLFALAMLALGCDDRTKMPAHDARSTEGAGAAEVAYVDLRSSESLVKRLPVEPDPANRNKAFDATWEDAGALTVA